MRAVLLLVAVTRNGWDSPSPAAIPVRETVCSGASSSSTMSLSGDRVGASLTAFTVTVNEVCTVRLSAAVLRSPSRPPSSTVTVMIAVPLWPGTGVNSIDPTVSSEM